MKERLEKMFTSSMYEYPHLWVEYAENGYLDNYASKGWGIRNIPKKGEYVLESTSDGSPAFQVTYVNGKTARIRVKKTRLQIQYNEILREHRKKFPNRMIDPEGSKILLVEGKK